MDLQTFRALVDDTPPEVSDAEASDLVQLYSYVGIPGASHYSRQKALDALSARIRGSFTGGLRSAAELCRTLRTDLIREHVVLDSPLDPYLDVIEQLRSATAESEDAADTPIAGDWKQAVRAAQDAIKLGTPRHLDIKLAYRREYAVALAARRLKLGGYKIELSHGQIGLTDAGEAKVVEQIEALVAGLGGLNVARRIFAALEPVYDETQGRHHLVPRPSLIGDSTPLLPWGYLLQLAIKHVAGGSPQQTSDASWDHLVALARDYAAIIDVQPYSPIAFRTLRAADLTDYLRELALFDTLFRIPQIRPSDVGRMARGMLDFINAALPTKAGWTVDEALLVIEYMMDPTRGRRGPVVLEARKIRKALPSLPAAKLGQILDEVLAHGIEGANQKYARPDDAPTDEDKSLGADFSRRPLLRLSPGRYVMIDRAVCAPACLEALLSPLRAEHKRLDDSVGLSTERFLEAEMLRSGVPSCSGTYRDGKEDGECDMVVETGDRVFFFELKKKPLTRRAKAGFDVELLLDLAGSSIAALAQAGWHEERIKRTGSLDLTRGGVTQRVGLNDREIENVAVAMLDYGSFQDRIVLKQLFEASLNAEFNPIDAKHAKRFKSLNESLGELRDQVRAKRALGEPADQPFFNCWFLSLPQMLVVLDDVSSPQAFRDTLWAARHVTTGASDFYFELAEAQKRTVKPAG